MWRLPLPLAGSVRLLRASGSLKLRLALTGALAIGLSVALTVLLVMRDIQHRAEQSILDSALDVATLSQNLSARLLERQLSLIRAAALWPHKDRPSAQIDYPRASSYLAGQSVLQGLFFSTFLVDQNGIVVASADQDAVRPVRFDVSHRDYFKQTMAENRPVVSAPLISVRFDVGEIIFTAPVRDARGQVMAVLGGVLRLQSRNFLSELTRDSSSGHERAPVQTIVTDARGRIIAHPDSGWLMKELDQDPRWAPWFSQWRAAGQPMEPMPSALRSDGHFLAVAAVPEANWMIHRLAPADALLGQPQAARVEAFWVGSGVALVGALVIFAVMAWLLRPLQQLQRRALSLLDETPAEAQAPWPQTRGEIAELATVFQYVIEQREQSRRDGDALFKRMQAVMVHAPVGIVFTRDRRFELVGEHYADLFGYSAMELVGRPHSTVFISVEAYRAMADRATAAFMADQGYTDEVEFQRKDGSRFWGYLQGAALNHLDPFAGTIWIVSDFTDLRKQREKLAWTASHDPLTDLVNRREFEQRLSQQLADRRRSEAASALFIDLDGFKAVNDTAGHAAGDAILKAVAAILSQRVREHDTVARLGGDEFAVLLEHCDLAQAELVAEQIRAKVQAHTLAWQDLALGVTASIGVVEIGPQTSSMEAVLAAADAACYQAKRAGRNQVCVWKAKKSD